MLEPSINPRPICETISIQDDEVLEEEETFFIRLTSTDTRIILTESSNATVVITDNDLGNFFLQVQNIHIHIYTYIILGLVVAGLEQVMYTVNEPDSAVIVCAIQMADIEREVTLTFSTISDTATGIL